jgi:hypothetical protein
MPTGPRLWLRPERRDTGGRVTHAATWLILDGSRQLGTGCHADDRRAAEQALGTSEIPIADVLTLYLRDVAPRHSRPGEAVKRLRRLGTFFASHTLADINGPLCREYAEAQNTDTMARRDLEELRAAINHHRREGLHDRLISVVAPPRRPSRERWLTRSEAARLIWAAWRFREVRDGRPTSKRPRRHIAHFILVALYTGSRASVVSQAALQPEPGRPYVDLDHGMLYRRPAGAKESNKRRPTIPLPEALIAHLRRWKRAGHRYRGMGRPPGPEDRHNLSPYRQGRQAWARRDPPHPTSHGGDLDDAGRNRSMGGRRLSWDDRVDARTGLWTSPSGPPRKRPQCVSAAPNRQYFAK